VLFIYFNGPFIKNVISLRTGEYSEMIIIYTQDKTYIHKDADSAKADLISAYGTKFGCEAYENVKKAREGTRYRKNGGPLVCVVGKKEADKISEKESMIGMI